jgi:sugar/nucleoside kinase (ribokinase family)
MVRLIPSFYIGVDTMIEKRVICAGHICLDITPDLSSVPGGQFAELFQPGQMVLAKGLNLRAGGAAANTGLVLNNLGVPVQIIGKIGDDLFGVSLKEWIKSQDPALAADLVIDPGAATSFTLIINPPGLDRTFIHYQGANDGFYASDLPRVKLQEADLFHFGYPSLMRSIYRGDGAELVSIMLRARKAGLTTSLDVSLPDPTSGAGQADWLEVLANSLPWVDIFTPNAAELSFMLDKQTYLRHNAVSGEPFLDWVTPEYLHGLSEKVLAYGVKILMIKVGHRGIFLRTAGERAWQKAGRGLAGLGEAWHEREIWVPAFKVEVGGTTGAGDAATAGFLAGLLRAEAPENTLRLAAAAGAASVESADAAGGLVSWEALQERVDLGWITNPLDFQQSDGWRRDENSLWQKE